MDINFIKSKLDVKNLSENQLVSLDKLIILHNIGKISIHTYFNLINTQINIGLDDSYDRILQIITEGRSKDSSSLQSNIIRYGVEEGTKRFNNKNKKSVSTLGSYIIKYGEIDGPIRFKELTIKKGHSLKGYILRHGEIDGPLKHKEYWENTGFGTTKRSFVKRYGDGWEEEFDKFRKSQGEHNTLKYHIEKYGSEDGVLKFNNRQTKRSNSICKETLIQKLLDDGLGLDDILEIIRDRWDNTSQKSFIKRYGDELGIIEYEKYIQKSKESNPTCHEFYIKEGIKEEVYTKIISKLQFDRNNNPYTRNASKESILHLLPIISVITELYNNLDVRFDSNEYGIICNDDETNISKGKRCCFYDLTFPELNLIIEYHGVRWHDDVDYSSTINMSKKSFINDFNFDLFKKWLAEQRGFTVFVLRSWNLIEDKKEINKYLISKGATEKCLAKLF